MLKLFVLLLAALVLAAPAYSQQIDPLIYSQNREYVDIIVEADSDISAYLDASDAEKHGEGNFYSMSIQKDDIQTLENMESVKQVWLEREYNILLDTSVPLINPAPFLDSSYNGTGVKVCVLDTGINKTHPALAGRVINWSDFTVENDVNDIHGHGTHVAGIIASNDATYMGVAPGASLLNAKVCRKDGKCSDSDIISGIDWCISNGADILSLSLGSTSGPNDGSDVLSQYLDLAADSGKVIVVSAGNGGPDNGTIACPACAHKVISAGSTTKSDVVSGFSSRGPTDDGRTLPDVTAPGSSIISLHKSGGFTSFSGTSMSAPHVSGLAALILQARNMTSQEVKTLIMNTAIDLGSPGKDNAYGAGRVNGSKVFDNINNTHKGYADRQIAHNMFVENGSEIRATLYWPENYSYHNDLNLQLLDPSGNLIVNSSSLYNTDESIRTTASVTGQWKIIVVNASAGQEYVIASSHPLSSGKFFSSGSLNTTAFYRINSTGQLSLHADWTGPDSIDMRVFNASGFPVQSISNITGNNRNTTILEEGTWTVRLNSSVYVKYFLTADGQIIDQFNDSSAPEINLNYIDNETRVTAFPSFSFSLSDDIGLVMECSIDVDNSISSLGNLTAGSQNIPLNLSEGRHNFTVTCTDASDKQSSKSLTVILDSTPPNLTFTRIDANNSFVSRNYTFINLTAADENGVDACIV
ncbi:S8 family peptidase, partial [Candidatus Woesearchaeota archaeon]|nr:S8 family peptidase [Candidatus Woesearchaeota archaeon]